jgi:hypothetical protein
LQRLTWTSWTKSQGHTSWLNTRESMLPSSFAGMEASDSICLKCLYK